MNQSTRQQSYIDVKTHELSNFKYLSLFYGNFYKCYIFEHKYIDSRRVIVERYENFRYNKYQNYRPQTYPPRNINSFSPLMNDVECFKCDNFGNMTSECERKFEYSLKSQNAWQLDFQKDKKN